jgi:hypothetical protein
MLIVDSSSRCRLPIEVLQHPAGEVPARQPMSDIASASLCMFLHLSALLISYDMWCVSWESISPTYFCRTMPMWPGLYAFRPCSLLTGMSFVRSPTQIKNSFHLITFLHLNMDILIGNAWIYISTMCFKRNLLYHVFSWYMINLTEFFLCIQAIDHLYKF